MIEFSGYLSGNAEKHFFKKARDYAQTLLTIGAVLALPVVGILGFQMYTWIPLGVNCALFIIIPLLVRIPKSKREKISITPKKICIDDDYIICIADKYEECRTISDVKSVLDHGDFYELIFPFGKVSEKFVCQKNLLTKGSLVEFELLFENKIER